MPSEVSSTILRNTAAMLVSRLVSRAFQFVLVIYAARVLGAADFGVFSWAFALTGLIAVFMDPGLSRYSVQQLARSRQEIPVYFGGNLVIKIILVLAGLAALWVIGHAMGRDRFAIQAALLLGLMAGVDSLGRCVLMMFQAVQRMEYEGLVISVSGVLLSLVGFAALYLYPSLLVFCGVFVLGALFRLLISLWIYRGRFPWPSFRFPASFVLKLLKKGLPFAMTTIFVTIYYYVDTVILGFYETDQAIGYYGAAYRFIEAPLFLISGLTTALFPAVSRLFAQDKDQIRALVQQIFPKVMALGLSISLIIAYLSTDLVRLLYGPQYLPAAGVLRVLIMSVAIIMPATVLGTTVRAIDRQMVNAVITGCAAALNIILNLIFIPRYSIMGAAWTTLATEAFSLTTHVIIVWRMVGPVISRGGLLGIVVMGAVLIACLHLTQSWNFWVRSAFALAVWAPLLFVTRIVSLKSVMNIIGAVLPLGRK